MNDPLGPAFLRARVLFGAAAIGCFGAVMAAPTGAMSQGAAGPFSPLAGKWSGGGSMTRADGGRERIRCRADYNVGGAGRTMRQSLRCASDSVRFNLNGDLRVRANGDIEGNWREGSRNAGGSITGVARNGQISGMIDGAGFAAQVSLRTQGRTQRLVLESKGEIRAVSINLRRVR